MNLTNISAAEEAFIRQKYTYWIDAENALRTKYSGSSIQKAAFLVNKVNASEYLYSPGIRFGHTETKAGNAQPRYLANGSIGNNLPTIQNPDRFDSTDNCVLLLSSMRAGSEIGQYYSDSTLYNTPIGHNNHTIFLVMKAHITVGKRVHINESILSVGKFPRKDISNSTFFNAFEDKLYEAASFGSYQIDCGNTGWNHSWLEIGFRGTVRGILGGVEYDYAQYVDDHTDLTNAYNNKVAGDTRTKSEWGRDHWLANGQNEPHRIIKNTSTTNILPAPTSVHSNNNSNILEIVYDADNNKMSGFANGTAGFQNQPLIARLPPASRIALFCNRGLGRGFKSEIGELIVINSVDSADRNYVREYLSGKWGISIA
jgi:hypothetical protein